MSCFAAILFRLQITVFFAWLFFVSWRRGWIFWETRIDKNRPRKVLQTKHSKYIRNVLILPDYMIFIKHNIIICIFWSANDTKKQSRRFVLKIWLAVCRSISSACCCLQQGTPEKEWALCQVGTGPYLDCDNMTVVKCFQNDVLSDDIGFLVHVLFCLDSFAVYDVFVMSCFLSLQVHGDGRGKHRGFFRWANSIGGKRSLSAWKLPRSKMALNKKRMGSFLGDFKNHPTVSLLKARIQ